MSDLDRIREANRYDASDYLEFRISGVDVGLVRHRFAESLRRWPDVFAVSEECLRLAPVLNAEDSDPQTRSAAVDTVLQQLHAEGKIQNWYDEAFPVGRSWGDPPILLMERAGRKTSRPPPASWTTWLPAASRTGSRSRKTR